MSLITAPLGSVDAYVKYLSAAPLPVLRRTVREIALLKTEMENVNSRRIVATILNDPLMAIRLLMYMEGHRRQSQNRDIVTIDHAIMMMGVKPFFDLFNDLPTLEDTLSDMPKALIGALRVIGRAKRVSQYARDWAILRHDLDVDEITVAALLQETTEILCWIFAPELTQRVYGLQQADRTMRSSVAQNIVFGVTETEIQLALIHEWKLPKLLVQLMDETQVDHPRVRTIRLAWRFTRHVMRGWDDPAIPSDIEDIVKLLPIGRQQLLERLGAPEPVIAELMRIQL